MLFVHVGGVVCMVKRRHTTVCAILRTQKDRTVEKITV